MANNGIRRVKIADLIPDKRNANLHSERGVYMVSRSLEKLGAGRSILIDKDNEIIAGNLTAEQAADMGLEEVIIVPTDGKQLVAVQRVDMDLDDPETGAREMAYADNRAAVVSIDFDPDQVKLDYDAGLDLGDWWQDFELEELGVVEPDVPEDVPPQIDRAEELRVKWGVESGQLWQLGEHRVICGDCTDRAVVERLMGESPFGVVHADPPYGMNLDADFSKMPETRIHSRTYDNVQGDDSDFDPQPFIRQFEGAGDQFWWGADYYYDKLPSGGSWFIWDKRNDNSAGLVGNHFEACWSIKKHRRVVFRVHWSGVNARNEFERMHPTEKSVKVVEKLLDYSDGDVLDPFLGSGTTLIACERLGRKCYGVEIEPKYIAVTLQRWHDVTGRDPVLLD